MALSITLFLIMRVGWRFDGLSRLQVTPGEQSTITLGLYMRADGDDLLSSLPFL